MKSRIRPPWPSALSAITRPWWQLLGPSLLVMSLASGANMIAGIGLARLLDPTDLGKYMLLISLAGILGLVGSRGQPGLTKRIYALSPPGTYDWLHDTGHGVLFALPTLIGALVAVIVLYRLTMSAALTLMALLSLSLLTLFVVQVLLSARCYARGNLLIRLPNALMTLPVLLLSFGEQTIIYTSVVGYRLLAALIVLGLGIHWMRSATERGPNVIPRSERKRGSDYLALSATSLLSGEGKLALAGLVLVPDQVGALAAMIVLARPYQMLQLVILQVSSVEAARHTGMPRWRDYARIVVVTLVGTTFIMACFPMLMSWIYGGRYDAYSRLGVPLMFAAAFALLESSPRGVITGQAQPSLVHTYSRVQITGALLGVLALLLAGQRAGIAGVAWSLFIYALAQCIISVGAAYLFLPSRSMGDRFR